MPSHILRLLLLLLTPLWLSLGADMLGLRLSLPAPVADWLLKDKAADPARLPPPGWRESAYLAANPDVAAAVRDGLLPSGYEHYVRFGRAEGRPGVPPAPAAAPGITTAAADPAALEPLFPGLVPSKPVSPAPVPTEPPLPTAAPPPPPAAPASTPVSVAQDTPPEEPAAVLPPLPADMEAEAMPVAAPPLALLLPSPPASPPPVTAPAVTPAMTPIMAPVPAQKPKPATAPLLVSRIRTANNGTITRIVLDLDGPPRFNPPVHKADRLEVELPGTLWKGATTGRLPALPLTYRVETPADTVSRLVIGGAEPLEIKAIFTLPPDKERGHRLVIDVAMAKEPAARKRT